MIVFTICCVLAGICFGFVLGYQAWERTIGARYEECIDDIIASNRRLRRKLSERRTEGDEWKDG